MPALDRCHSQVVRALEKAGWKVAPHPVALSVPNGPTLLADILAQQIDDQDIIVVETKCFPDSSAETSELYTAIGQYIIYRDVLRRKGSTEPIYLAVPIEAYQGIFRLLAASVISELGMKLIVIDMVHEVIIEWIE